MKTTRTGTRAGIVAAALLALTVSLAPAASAQTTTHASSPVSAGVAALVAKHTIPFTAATVTDHGDHTYTVTWNAPGVSRVRIYTGSGQDRIDRSRAVAQGGASGTVTVRVSAGSDRQWFQLVPERGDSLTLADRLVRLSGTSNFRDLGGYRTADGEWVAMGEVYRSDALDKLTDADLATLRRLDIRTDIDLRTADERASAPDRVPTGATYVVADVLGGSVTSTFNPTTPEAAAQLMIDAERTMVSSDTAQAAYTTVFDAVRRPGALVLHCTAGKDRTGWASAALLTTLGVPASTVRSDYLLSNDYRADANAAALAQLPPAYAAVYQPLLDVRPEYLAAGFDEVQARYGSWASYLRSGLDQNLLDGLVLRADLLRH